MRLIPLTQNQFALVDAADYDWLNQWKWYAWWNPCTKSFYAVKNEKVDEKWQTLLMSRLILGLTYGDKRQCDHLHHNTLDNRRKELRIVTHNQNQWNYKNTKGYYWHKKAGKYLAQIMVRRKYIYLGLHASAKEARAAYVTAKEKYHVI